MKRWYYEDDFDVRKKLEKKGAAALKVNKGRVQNSYYDDESDYGDEYDDEDDGYGNQISKYKVRKDEFEYI